MKPPVEIAAHTGVGAFQRGVAYARQGRAVVMSEDPHSGRVTGTCRGSGGHTYAVTLTHTFSAADVLTSLDGTCSCPVHHNCKHVVALLLTALEATDPPDFPSARVDPVGAERGRSQSDWRQLLSSMFPATSPGASPLALAVSLTIPREPGEPWQPGQAPVTRWNGDFGSPGSLSVRPLSMGKRQRWIVSGATWSRIARHGVGGADPAQVDALDRLHTLVDSASSSMSASPTWLDLSRDVGPALWLVLDDLVASGVQLLEDSTRRPVHLETDPAHAEVRIHQDESGSVSVDATISFPFAPDASRRVVLGSPAHGIAWLDGAGVHLARLDAPAPLAWQHLRDAREPVVVPARDRSEFEREILPRIEAVGWSSPDGTFSPEPPPEPVLHLDVVPDEGSAWGHPAGAHAGGVPGPSGAPSAHLRWSWVRTWSDSRGRVVSPVAGNGTGRVPGGETDDQRRLLAEVAPVIRSVIGGPDLERPAPDVHVRGLDLVRVLDEAAPRLEDLGVEVAVSQWPQWSDAGTPVVRVEATDQDPDWLDLELGVSVAGVEVPMAALITALTREEDALFLPDGTYARLDDPAFDDLRRLLAEARELDDPRRHGLRVPRVRTSWWEDLLGLDVVETRGSDWFEAVRRAVANPPAPAEVPAAMHARLRPYQVRGFQWLAGLRRAGLGGVLADDMGLGKTVQILAMILDEREHPGSVGATANVGEAATGDSTSSAARGPWIVVAPTSVVGNWVSEAARFAPDLRVASIEATASGRGAELAETADGVDILVTSYALLRLEQEDYAGLGAAGMVLDEAQNAKNAASRTFSAIQAVGAPVVFAVTGTPMENHLGELWSMFALTAPGLLGSAAQFQKVVRRPIEKGEDEGGALMARLRRRIAPFLLRRTKEDVALDLPPKQEQYIDVELSAAHRRIYDRHLQRERQRALHLAEDMDHNRVEILAALTRLRELAIDPGLVEEDTDVTSSKLEALIPLLVNAAEEGHRVLVFSQFTRFLRRIADRLDRSGLSFVHLDGTTTHRDRVIREFAEGDAPVFLISLKAGGVGVNLAMADYAVLVDPWWSPAVEEQAVDRAHRIGQTRPVHVYRLVARSTIEEKVLVLQARKRKLAEDVLGAGEGAGAAGMASGGIGGTKLGLEDLKDLLG